MATITTLENNITGLSFRQQVNSNFENLNTDKVENTSLDATNTRVTNLETYRTATLEPLETEVDTIDSRLQALEQYDVFEYQQVNNHSVTTTVYADVINFTTANLEAGIYKVALGQMFNLDSAVNLAWFRASFDGGLTWMEVAEKVVDVSANKPLSFFTVINHPGGTVNIITQAKKDATGDVLNIVQQTMTLERKQ